MGSELAKVRLSMDLDKLKNVVDIRSLGRLLKRSIFQCVNSSLSTWLYLTLSPVPSMSAEIGICCHWVSTSLEGQQIRGGDGLPHPRHCLPHPSSGICDGTWSLCVLWDLKY